jgi:hypothetical protein
MSKNATRKRIREHLLDCFEFTLGNELVQKRHFSTTEQLYPLIRERIIKTRKRQTGPVEIRYGYFPHQTPPTANTAQIKRVVFLEIQAKQVEHGKPFNSHT